jgi:hypothetical protein
MRQDQIVQKWHRLSAIAIYLSIYFTAEILNESIREYVDDENLIYLIFQAGIEEQSILFLLILSLLKLDRLCTIMTVLKAPLITQRYIVL